MRTAMIQMKVVGDKQANLAHAGELLKKAKEQGAQLAVLPEMFCCPYGNAYFRPYGEQEGGEAWQALSALAKELDTTNLQPETQA